MPTPSSYHMHTASLVVCTMVLRVVLLQCTLEDVGLMLPQMQYCYRTHCTVDACPLPTG